MSAIDYKALAERVAQRAIYADNNADPNNKAWAADLRAVVSLLNGMADAQPVAAVPVDWMERLKEAVKHICYANVEKWYRLGGEDMIEQAKSDAVTAYATLCEALESLYAAPAAPQAEPKRDWTSVDAAIREYLDDYELIVEDDAGADAYYTPTERELYLIYDSINGLLADESFVAAISVPQAQPKREPLDDDEISKLAWQQNVWTDGMIEFSFLAFARAVERAHGIGGSDAE